jgi:hypothetical protein
MPQTFKNQVEITGLGNQILELTCTPSRLTSAYCANAARNEVYGVGLNV